MPANERDALINCFMFFSDHQYTLHTDRCESIIDYGSTEVMTKANNCIPANFVSATINSPTHQQIASVQEGLSRNRVATYRPESSTNEVDVRTHCSAFEHLSEKKSYFSYFY